MLGLGRAIGETIAVTIVIGDAPTIGKQLFGQGYSLAAVIANEFGEAAQPLHRSALFAAGLVLFVLTLLVNAVARGHRPALRARPARRARRDGRGRLGRGGGAHELAAARQRPPPAHRPRHARPCSARRPWSR